ncbi:MAG: hypothetical protein L3J10_02110 [Sulfurimonas sp.]|nr:hypothetical protein [Sulfurimonas sp.]
MKILVIILLLLISLFADDYNNHSERHINKEISHLKLSKSQEIEVKKILKDFRYNLREFSEYKEDIQEKKKNLFVAKKLDMQELIKLNKSLDEKRHKTENKFLQMMHKTLSDKQKEKFIYYFDDWEVE